MSKDVVVIGGGVAGMSAAHELMERGFNVKVYERQPKIPGGKARSIPVPNTGTDDRPDLPGEHGFRFFPGFYHNLPDTMKRIPYEPTGKTVFDNLTTTSRVALTQFGKRPVVIPARFPTSLKDLELLYDAVVKEFKDDIGLKPGELEYYAERIWQIMTSCKERRADEYERLDWWTFIDAENKSPGYQKFLAEGLTRSLVAADAKVGNAKVTGDTGVQLVRDQTTPGIQADRVLDGPTNMVWIDPWLKYLTDNGVEYTFHAHMQAITAEDGVIKSVTLLDTETGATYEVSGDYYVIATPVEVLARVLKNDIIHNDPNDPNSIPEYRNVLAADPSLAGIVTLGRSVAWMNGLQIYLSEDVPIVHGHTIYLDSPWSITSISQQQFWPNFDLKDFGDGTVQGVISVDISDWNTPGILFKKPANQCTREQIFKEVWAQMKLSLNVDGNVLLRDEMVRDWNLDPDIDDVTDDMRQNPSLYEDAEPLLVSVVNTWDLRPDAYTRIPNLFLASDYVRTNIQLATMEGANEAARRATNAIIEASGVKAPYCRVWGMQEPWFLFFSRWEDQQRYKKGLPWNKKSTWLINLLHNVAVRLFNYWRHFI